VTCTGGKAGRGHKRGGRWNNEQKKEDSGVRPAYRTELRISSREDNHQTADRGRGRGFGMSMRKLGRAKPRTFKNRSPGEKATRSKGEREDRAYAFGGDAGKKMKEGGALETK